jgi:hypothetical protein
MALGEWIEDVDRQMVEVLPENNGKELIIKETATENNSSVDKELWMAGSH